MRRPNLRAAGVDLALAALALAAGWAGLALRYAALILVAAALLWAWTRRAALAPMDWPRRVTNGALALGMLTVVLGLAYWLGLMFGGHR